MCNCLLAVIVSFFRFDRPTLCVWYFKISFCVIIFCRVWFCYHCHHPHHLILFTDLWSRGEYKIWNSKRYSWWLQCVSLIKAIIVWQSTPSNNSLTEETEGWRVDVRHRWLLAVTCYSAAVVITITYLLLWWPCQSVCKHAYLRNRMPRLHHIFCTTLSGSVLLWRRCNRLYTSGFDDEGGSVAEWLAYWTQAQKARAQIAVATLSGSSLRQTALCLCSPISKIGSSPLKGCGGNCRPGGK